MPVATIADIRRLMIDGQPWFRARDIEWLYKLRSTVIITRELPAEDKRRVSASRDWRHPLTEMYISEAGLLTVARQHSPIPLAEVRRQLAEL